MIETLPKKITEKSSHIIKYLGQTTGGPFKQFEATSIEFDSQRLLSTEFTDQNCFLF